MPDKTLEGEKVANQAFDTEIDINSHREDGLWLRLLTYLRWYPQDMPHLEKQLLFKLDVLILVFGCLSFFTKYLDQQAITNAYVSYVSMPPLIRGDLKLTKHPVVVCEKTSAWAGMISTI